VRLLAHDPLRHALLLERCRPGTYLSEHALDVLVELLPRLWKPAGAPFTSLEDEAAWWVSTMRSDWEQAGKPFEETLVDAAISILEELVPSQGEQVLLHQDLHAGNVLAAEREPWLVIDPKPLAAEREFAVAPIVRSFELGHSKREALYRLDRLCSELGLDRERARGWTIVQTVAWSGGSDYIEEHMETVEWIR
jgi:streptomycin 6-kinase